MTLHWPQIVYLGLAIFGLGSTLVQHGKPREGTYNFVYSFIAFLIMLILLSYGGFFGGEYCH